MSVTLTPSQTVGPYLHIGLTDTRSLSQIAADGAPGERIFLACNVFDADDMAVPDAMIELWQADADGRYHHPEDAPERVQDPLFRGHGRMPTNAQGSCSFQTIKPGQVPGPDGTLQAPHVNVSLFARGLLKRLVTRIYFPDESLNASDAILNAVPSARRSTMIARVESMSPTLTFRFDIVLQGETETVFLDV